MPPDGYTTVTISNELVGKLAQIMAVQDCSSYAEAIEYAVDTTLLREDEITTHDLIQLLADRLDNIEESNLP
ncbi:MAG: hypothetical protein V5A29_17715 [Haloarculaceae archaeon]